MAFFLYHDLLMKRKQWLLSILWGVLSSGIVSSIITYQDWSLNPSGIFYSEESGTNWAFVWDTFFSWFWPLLPVLVIVSLVVMLFSLWIRRRRDKASH